MVSESPVRQPRSDGAAPAAGTLPIWARASSDLVRSRNGCGAQLMSALFADAVVVEAALSFLGFGISRPEASLGNMLTNAQDYFIRAPIMVVWPGLILILMVLSASFLGDGLRDALDPRQKIDAS